MEDYTFEQKNILANTIETINDKKILKQIKQLLIHHNVKFQKQDHQISCHFHNLNPQIYYDLQLIIDNYNNSKQNSNSLTNIDSDNCSNHKLKNSQKRILNTYNYQQALKSTLNEFKKK